METQGVGLISFSKTDVANDLDDCVIAEDLARRRATPLLLREPRQYHQLRNVNRSVDVVFTSFRPLILKRGLMLAVN
jgi:hypothetical protein